MVKKGAVALEMAEFDDAIEMFGRAAVEDATNPRAWFYLGVCYLEIRQTDVAAEAFERAIAADPEFTDAHYLLGTAMGSLGQLDGAANCYRRALAIDPQHQKAEEFLIRTEAMLASRQHYRSAIGMIYAEQREPDWINPVVRELLHSVAIFKDSPAASEMPRVANEVIREGRRRLVHEVSASDGPFWASAVRRAEQAFERKNWPEAASRYHEALDLSADHAFIHHALGLIYFSLGDLEGGMHAWQHTLDLAPDYDFSSIGSLGSI